MMHLFNQHPMRCIADRHKRNITYLIHTVSQALSHVCILAPFSKLQAWYFALKIYFVPYCLKLLINKKGAKLELFTYVQTSEFKNAIFLVLAVISICSTLFGDKVDTAIVAKVKISICTDDKDYKPQYIEKLIF